MGSMMDLKNWKSQIRKGLIEFCILTIVERRGQAYGLELIEGLQAVNLDITEGTLYPLLSRLVRDKILTPKWETPDVGHPRKYYRLSTGGRTVLKEMKNNWEEITQSIENLGHSPKGPQKVRSLTC